MSERRRARAASSANGARRVPRALAVGRLIEVWAEDGKNTVQAWTRYSSARRAWLEGSADETLGLRDSSPWSQTFLDAEGRGDYVTARLVAAGVTRGDIPKLRRQAEGLLKQTSQSNVSGVPDSG